MIQFTAEQYEIIQGAYLSGFEPSNDSLTNEQMFSEAKEYLLTDLTK